VNQIVINGDNIEVLKTYPDNYFDAVVTDPPYGLGKEPDAVELMKNWIEHGYHEIKGSGFMGKEWDAFVPQPLFWKEVFRVLKHGGHVVSFFGTRTYDWGVMAMRFAGFEVRDCIQWIYGSGFPKSHNIGKNIEKIKVGGIKNLKQIGTKKGVTSESGVKGFSLTKEFVSGKYIGGKQVNGDVPIYEINNEYGGWGSALKPANEPIVLARKPLEKGLSIAENVLKYGTGGINIDGCRVGNEKITISQGDGFGNENNLYGNGVKKNKGEQHIGRFPANLILTHHPECECKGLKVVKGSIAIRENSGGNTFGGNNKKPPTNNLGYADENGEETIEDWNCHPDCPIRIMDEQSGQSKSNPRTTCDRRTNSTHEYGFKSDAYSPHLDSGGASRFFYCAKASKSERNKGLKGFVNGHPTIKPVKLMQYLVRLVTPPNGKVLDPFCGSGTTGIACKLEGFEFVGIEQDPEYTKIAEARINNWVEEKEEAKKESKSKEPKEEKKTLIQQNLF